MVLIAATIMSLVASNTQQQQSPSSSHVALLLRGGLVPQASEAGANYYEQFELDYGSADKRRIAGALRGFIRSGKIASLPEADPFLKWMNENLEKGPEATPGRIKPFYAADFGSKSDLKKGEHPKVIIVQRKLEVDEDGILKEPTQNIDVEIRNIWQPWLRARCNFAVRYIVPSRVNIIKILEAKRRFAHEVELDADGDEVPKLWAKMTFKPRLIGRLLGKRNKVLWRELDVSGATAGGGGSKSATRNRAAGLLSAAQGKLAALTKK